MLVNCRVLRKCPEHYRYVVGLSHIRKLGRTVMEKQLNLHCNEVINSCMKECDAEL